MDTDQQEKSCDYAARLAHEVRAAITRIPQANLSRTDAKLPETMSKEFELVGIRRAVRLWQSAYGQLPYESDVITLLKSMMQTLRNLKCGMLTACAAPVDKTRDLDAAYVQFEFQGYTFLTACEVTSYVVTGESGSGHGRISLYIGVREELLLD